MRMILYISFPVETFNAATRDGSAGAKMQRILGEQKAEAVYFTDRAGERSAVMVVNMNEASEIPKYCEPWFLQFNARIEVHPAMTPQDLAAGGLEALGKTWS